MTIIIFCEFLPKAFAKRFNYKFALDFAYIVRFFEIVFFIFVWPISKLFELIGRLFKKKSKEEEHIDEDVLNEMVDEIEESGDVEETGAEIVRNAIDLNDIQAYEIMTPRVDVYAIDVEDDINEIIKDEEFFIILVFQFTKTQLTILLVFFLLNRSLEPSLRIERLMLGN